MKLEIEKFEIEHYVLTFEGSQYFPPKYADHRPAVADLLQGKLYEPLTHEFVEAFLSLNHGSMVHAGTFFGDMLPNFSKAVSGHLFAFEPVFENYVLAKLCVDNNNLENVLLFNAALSDAHDILRINTYQNDGRHAGGGSNIASKGALCTSMTIDSLNAQDLVLIQLDVEGHELQALKGAVDSIQRCRPVIAVEDNHNNCSPFLLERSYELLREIPGLHIWCPTENARYRSQCVAKR